MATSNEMEKHVIASLIETQKTAIIFMNNGFQMRGHIKAQDDIAIKTSSDGKDRLVYKCNISTIEYES